MLLSRQFVLGNCRHEVMRSFSLFSGFLLRRRLQDHILPIFIVMPWEHHRLVHSGLGSSTSWSSRLASVVELSSCHMLTAYRNFLRVFPFSFMAKPVQFSIQSILISIQCSPKLFFKITPRFSAFGNVGCPIFLQLCLGKKETFLYLAQNYVHSTQRQKINICFTLAHIVRCVKLQKMFKKIGNIVARCAI